MDEIVLRRILRQLKLLNFWIAFFGTLFLLSLIAAGVLLFKLVTFVQKTEQNLNQLQQTTSQNLNIQKQACSNSSISTLLNQAGNYCK